MYNDMEQSMTVVQINDMMSIGGQPDEADIAGLGEANFRRLIDLRPDGEETTPSPAVGGARGRRAGMSFSFIPNDHYHRSRHPRLPGRSATRTGRCSRTARAARHGAMCSARFSTIWLPTTSSLSKRHASTCPAPLRGCSATPRGRATSKAFTSPAPAASVCGLRPADENAQSSIRARFRREVGSTATRSADAIWTTSPPRN